MGCVERAPLLRCAFSDETTNKAANDAPLPNTDNRTKMSRVLVGRFCGTIPNCHEFHCTFSYNWKSHETSYTLNADGSVAHHLRPTEYNAMVLLQFESVAKPVRALSDSLAPTLELLVCELD